MRAEIHGKLDLESSSAAERAEDLLTDYVFTVLDVIDRSGLALILRTAFPHVRWADGDIESAVFQFWPRFPGGTEPDVLILVGLQPVVVEAKYRSGFGVGESAELDQLVREFRHGSEWSAMRGLRPPLVLAVTSDASEPLEVSTARLLLADLGVEDAFLSLAWTNWHRMSRAIESLVGIGPGDQRMIQQLMVVLERRGVRHVFEGIQEEDYWVVAAAQRIAAERVFPTIATFARELLDGLGERMIVKATTDSRIATMRSESLQNPDKWGVSFLFLPLRHEMWSKPDKWSDRHLFVQFALHEPTLSVGYRVEIKGQATTNALRSVLDEWVSAFRGMGEGRTVTAVKYPDLHRPLLESTLADITTPWIEQALARSPMFLNVERRLSLAHVVSSGRVVELVDEDHLLVESTGLLALSEAL